MSSNRNDRGAMTDLSLTITVALIVALVIYLISALGAVAQAQGVALPPSQGPGPYQSAPAAPATASKEKPEPPVCFDGKCIPMSVIRVEFENYLPDAAPPTSQIRQLLIQVQTQLASEMQSRRQCEATLGPLQAEQHGKQLQQQQADLDATNAKAAPAGKVWDAKQQRYVTPPPPTLPVPAQTPAPAPTGRGRGGK